jgi:hypothetical protein
MLATMLQVSTSVIYVKIITAYTKVHCYYSYPWVWRLVCHTNGRTQVQNVWEQKTWHLGRTKWLEKVAFEGRAGSIATHRMGKACHAWETLEMRSQFRLQTLKGRPRRRWEDNRLLLDIEKIGSVAGSCEHGDKFSGFIRLEGREFLD